MRIPSVLAAVFLMASPAARVSAQEIERSESDLSGSPYTIQKPKGKGPFPLLVILPALRYTRTGRIFERLGEGAARLGYYVVRPDWRFVADKTQPSPDLADEARQAASVLDEFASNPEIDPKRIVVAAKSFGVKVLLKAPAVLEAGRAILLITPNCDDKDTFEKAHEPVFSRGKPVHIVISVTDPYCDIRQIYSAMEGKGPDTTLHTLYGGHNFELQGSTSALNEDAAIRGALAWLEKQTQR